MSPLSPLPHLWHLSLVLVVFLAPYARAIDVTVDPSWTWNEVNNVMDGDPLTTGKNGELDVVPGDSVLFTDGEYVFPAVPGEGAMYHVRVPNITLKGTGEYTTFIRGNIDASSAVLIKVHEPNVTISDMCLDRALVGIVFQDNYSSSTSAFNTLAVPASNTVERINGFDIDTFSQWKNIPVGTDNLAPTISFSGVYLDNVSGGFDYNGDFTDSLSPWISIKNSRLSRISFFGVEPPFYPPAPGDCNVVPLVSDGVVFENSPNGSSFVNEVPQSQQCNNSMVNSSSVQASQPLILNAIGEFDVGTNVPSYPGTLAELGIGTNNFDDTMGNDPVNTWGYNLPGSIAMGSQLPNGFSGKGVAGDVNNNGRLTPIDFYAFKNIFDTPIQDQNPNVIARNDFNSDGVVDILDFNGQGLSFIDGYEGPKNFVCSQGAYYQTLEDLLLGNSIDSDRNAIPDGCIAYSPPPKKTPKPKTPRLDRILPPLRTVAPVSEETRLIETSER